VATTTPRDMAISVITCAELLFGLEKRGNLRGLARVMHGFLDRMTRLP
jgi:predicted nucleic acid-binding protein